MQLNDIQQYIQHNDFLRESMPKIPHAWARPVVNSYRKNVKAHGMRAANLAVLDTLDAVGGFAFNVASDDDELCEFAKRRADECFRAAARNIDKDQALKAMINITLRYGIKPPAGRNVTKTGQRMRLLDELWWRRNVRKTAGRNVEQAAIGVGLVSRVAGLYASDDAVKRRRGQRARNRAALSNIEATNDVGQTYTMQALSDLGVSNPEIRRMELMTRIAGFDAVAIKHGHAADFYTLTAPSKYHARHHITGRSQPNYNGSTPAQTQAYLCKVWSRVRAKLHRAKITYYGFRVAEPHHDATPHWHMIIFCEQCNVTKIRAIFKHYAMQEDGEEAGAQKHRFKAELIDRKKGSAVGYIAKYISKNIDGKNNDGVSIGEDWEAVAGDDSVINTSRRVDAWASTWGIRQFQQLGGQSVTVWRELRRADPAEIESEDLQAIAAAAIAGDWQRYTELNGGVMLGRGRVVTLEKLGAIDHETGEIRLNNYGEQAADKIIGVKAGDTVVLTHLRVWDFKRKSVALAPRSSLNNCTQLDRDLNEKQKSAAKVAFLREVATRPAAQGLPYKAEKMEFLTGEDLERWKTKEKAPDPAAKWPVWPQCLQVLKCYALKSKALSAPA